MERCRREPLRFGGLQQPAFLPAEKLANQIQRTNLSRSGFSGEVRDDVLDLQGRLNALGFHAGREDGIFGDATREALSAFQRDAGLPPDGICGSTTVAALRRVGTMAEGSVATVREREELRRAERHLVGRKVYVAAAPGLAVLGEQVTRGLLDAGSRALLDTSGADDSLLANAAKYTPAGGIVEVAASSINGHVSLSVADNGPGVPEAERDIVFDKFYRGRHAQQRGEAGSGLGLAIVKSLVDLHGGSVRVEDSPPRGARFVVELPRATEEE